MPFDLTRLRQQDWLLGNSDRQSQDFNATFRQVWEARLGELRRVMAQSDYPPMVMIAEPDPVVFLGSVAAALAAHCPIALGNPAWAIAEWQAALTQVNPHVIWAANLPVQPERAPANIAIAQPDWVLIPTGGTSGKIRFAIHTWRTLTIAADGFRQHFNQPIVNSCCVLPLYHVSGLMQVIRVWRSQGQLALASFRNFAAGSLVHLDPTAFFVSLVPTQLQRVMPQSRVRDWLRRCRAVLLGGGPSWPPLRSQARQHQIPIALTYGMTETGAQVATLHPDLFLAGHESCGRVLPHVAIACVDEHGHLLPPGTPGILQIQTESLCLGYLPDVTLNRTFLADDVGYLDAQGELHLIGRHSTQLITGGENVFPEEVEAVIRETGCVVDVAIVGVSDCIWGDRIVAVFVPMTDRMLNSQPTQVQSPPHPTIAIALNQHLSRFKHPKFWMAVDELPRQGNGKLNRATITAIAEQWCQQYGSSHSG